MEHNFWLKFSAAKNLGVNYDKINPTAFVHNSNYNCFFRNPIYLWQKHVKQNSGRYDIMNAAISHKCRSITFYYGITSRNNYENLFVQIHNFIIENDKVSIYGVFSGPYFLAFGLNTERYEVSLRIQSKCGKIRTRKNSVYGHFPRRECFMQMI